MRTLDGVVLLVLWLPPFLQAEAQDVMLGFSGIVTENTCSHEISGGRIVKVHGKVTLNLNQCPENTLSGTAVSFRDLPGNTISPEFFFHTGERLIKGNPVERSRFVRTGPDGAALHLLLSTSSSGRDGIYGAVMHLNYD